MIFTEKQLCWSLFWIKLQAVRDRCFPLNIAKFSRTYILKNICERLLLSVKTVQSDLKKTVPSWHNRKYVPCFLDNRFKWIDKTLIIRVILIEKHVWMRGLKCLLITYPRHQQNNQLQDPLFPQDILLLYFAEYYANQPLDLRRKKGHNNRFCNVRD